MSPVTRLFQISGFDFVVPGYAPLLGIKRKVFARFVFLLHFAYICVNLEFQYSFHVKLFRHPDVLGNTTNLVEMVLPLFCHLVIVAEAFCKAKMEEKIKTLMLKVRTDLDYDAQPAALTLPVAKLLFLFVVNSLLFIGIIVMVSDTPGKCCRRRYKEMVVNYFIVNTNKASSTSTFDSRSFN